MYPRLLHPRQTHSRYDQDVIRLEDNDEHTFFFKYANGGLVFFSFLSFKRSAHNSEKSVIGRRGNRKIGGALIHGGGYVFPLPLTLIYIYFFFLLEIQGSLVLH